jgi:hypothetical protein
MHILKQKEVVVLAENNLLVLSDFRLLHDWNIFVAGYSSPPP